MAIRNFCWTRIVLTTLLLALILALTISVSAQQSHTTFSYTAPIEDFQLVTEQQGWVKVDNQLFWTDNNGADWREITPGPVNLIRAAKFIDPQNGFLVTEELTYTQALRYTLFTTDNQGATWSREEIFTLPIDDPLAATAKISIFFLDNQTGWINFKQATSSNFNLGRLYYTEDGGQTWQTKPAPVGDPAAFMNDHIGFIAGGLYAHNLYQTTDGGNNWNQASLTADIATAIGLPNFLNAQTASIPLFVTTEIGTELQFYSSTNTGGNWELSQSTLVSNQQDVLGFFNNLPGEIKAVSDDTIYTYYLTSGQLVESATLPLDNLTKIKFASHQSAWALFNQPNCTDDTPPCTSEQILYSTQDEGLSWQSVDIPTIYISQLLEAETDSALPIPDKVPLLSRTSVFTGQGFDQCEISSLSNLQAWKNHSPLSAVNLYIGGKARACANTNISDPATASDFVEALSIQGWKFIPTWVGPQAACTNYSVRMSDNPTNNYEVPRQQGKDQALDAIVYLQALGLSDPDGSGAVVYYDLEAFDVNNQQCLDAAKAFIDGWVWQLHQAGNTAGVYSSVCSGFTDFYTLDNPPDVIWPAFWRYSTPTYNSAVTPYGLPCISDSMWGDQQRIFQYTGAHAESWGNVAMNVDLDVIDGIVADISRQVGVATTTLQNPSFENGLVAPWLVQDDPLDCNWQVVTDSTVAHSDDHYFAINRGPGEVNCSGLAQTLTHTPTFGDRYRFAIWARSSSSANPRSLTLKITGEGAESTSTTQFFSSIGTDWVCLETNYDVANSSLIGITPKIELEDSDGIDLYLDNAHVSLNTGQLCPTIPYPSGLWAGASADQSSIEVSWDPVEAASYYLLYRTIAPESQKHYLDWTMTNQYTDADTNHWDEYRYWIQACNAGGCSPFSTVAVGKYASPGLDFFDGFESGNTSNWTLVNQPTNIYACTAGELSGNIGLCVDSDTTSGATLGYNFTQLVKEMKISFNFDPNSFYPGSGGNSFALLQLRDNTASKSPLTIKVRRDSAIYRISATAVDINGTSHSTDWISIENEPTQITLMWHASNLHARSTGTDLVGFSLWIDGTRKAQIYGIDTRQFAIDQVLFGGNNLDGVDDSSGIFYLDDFSYQRPLYIRD